MKRYICIYLLLVVKPLLAQQSLAEMGLKGKVKTMEEQFYPSYGEANKPLTISHLRFYAFDERGALVQLEMHSQDPDATEISVYKYNEDNKLISAATYNGTEVLLREKQYSYDKHKSLTKVRNLAYGVWTEDNYTNDQFGRKLTHAYKAFGVDFSYHYTYNNLNKLIQAKRYKNEKELIETITYSYDKNQQLIEIAKVLPTASTETTYERFKYNDKGMLIEESRFGFLKKTAYNAQGDPIHEDEGNISLSYVYKYAENGNWEIRETYKNDKAQSVTKRIIEYY